MTICQDTVRKADHLSPVKSCDKEIGPPELAIRFLSFCKEKRGGMKKHETIYIKHMLCLLPCCFLLMTLVYPGTMTRV